MSGLHVHTLLDKGLIPVKDESYLTNGYLDTKVDWIPGMQNFRLKDLPDFIRTTDPNAMMVGLLIEMAERVHKASAIVFNTFYELESDVMNALSSMFPSVYPIGPLPSFLSQSPQHHLASLGSNLWKEDTKCLEWLESKEPESVVYREEMEKQINELMVGEKGKKMRQKAMELKKKAEEDTRPGGCSYMNLDKVIKENFHKTILTHTASIHQNAIIKSNEKMSSWKLSRLAGAELGKNGFMESKKDKFSRPRDTMKNIIDQGEQTPNLSKSFIESKKKFSRPRDTMKNIIGDQGEKTPQMTKRHKASRPSSSMEDIIGEQEPWLNKRHKVSWPSSSMEDIIGEQEKQTPQLTKKHMVSWHDSMKDIIGELEEIASSPCQMPLAPQRINHEGSTSKKKKGSNKARSMKNKISRAKLTSMHTTGSKTFAEIRHEETMNNPDGRESTRMEMYIMTHKPKNGNPMNEGTCRIMSELKDAIASHPRELEQSTTRDDIFSQILGKDKLGHVCTYGKGVVPSDTWGPMYVLETQKIIEDVRRNAETEIQIIQEKMQEKIKEEVEAMKVEILGGLKLALNELQKCLLGVTIPNLFSIFIPDVNKGVVVNAHSTVNTHHAIVEAKKFIPNNVEDHMEPTHYVNFGSKKKKKRRKLTRGDISRVNKMNCILISFYLV
ncbi:putative transposase, Ptta/En/Spm, plant [Sesbania bispinosa]|nr:putative transposase, Ptta/En/Spm, plant [Sesbania bispinosa]